MVDLSTPCEWSLQGPPRQAEWKGVKRSRPQGCEVANPSLSADLDTEQTISESRLFCFVYSKRWEFTSLLYLQSTPNTYFEKGVFFMAAHIKI